MNIIIGADFVPTKTNEKFFMEGNIEQVISQELIQILLTKYKIFNLEVPLTDKLTPINKCGPNLIASTKCIALYKKLHVDLLTLANNHILDQGEQGLNNTIKVLDDAKINYVGAGKNLEIAKKPFYFDIFDKKIGIYACTEHEFSIASDKNGGANPVDLLSCFDEVISVKSQCDYLIVLYHGGKEHYRYPSPNLQKICRKMIECGSDLVVCQHSHCIGCEEKYMGGTIVYGQGNFLFDYSESKYWETSLLIEVKEDFTIDYIPLKKNKNAVRLANNIESEQILKEFYGRSEEIKNETFVEEAYRKFADASIKDYLVNFSGLGSNLFFRGLNKLSHNEFSKWFVNKLFSKSKLLSILNHIECEAHRELIIEGLKNRYKYLTPQD